MTRAGTAVLLAAWLTAAGAIGCAHAAAKEDARTQAQESGKYKVQLTTDRERVQGTCQFVRSISAYDNQLVVTRPTKAQMPDFFRVEAVLLGADTVLVEGDTGEAYICGPGPLNPDGTLKTLPPPETPVPSPKPG